VVDEEEPPLEQARAGTPPSPLPQNKGKGRARTLSEDSMIARPRHTTSWVSRRDPRQDDNRPRRSQSTALPLRETKSRQSVAESDQHSEYSSTSHHSSYNMSRHVMSTIDLTHEMAEIKELFARSAAIRADARQREKEAEEETARSQLRLNNLEITLRNVQHDTERMLRIILIRRIGETERTSASTNGLRPRCIAGPKYLQKSEDRSNVGKTWSKDQS
jgi:hypothetical protein